jgi:hypothetical protein
MSAHLLRGSGHGIEPDVGEEDHACSPDHSGDSEGEKGMPFQENLPPRGSFIISFIFPSNFAFMAGIFINDQN